MEQAIIYYGSQSTDAIIETERARKRKLAEEADNVPEV